MNICSQLFFTQRCCFEFFPMLVAGFWFDEFHMPITISNISQVFCDLHGHSQKKNIFMYGNEDLTNPIAVEQV